MVENLQQRVLPCLILALATGCADPADDFPGTEDETIYASQDQQIVATLQISYDGQNLRATPVVDEGFGFRAALLGPDEIEATILDAQFAPGQVLRLSAEFTNLSSEVDYGGVYFELNDQTSPGVTASMPVVNHVWRAGDTNGPYQFEVEYGDDEDFSFYIDVYADQHRFGGYEWSFSDEKNVDDVHTDELADFFRSIPRPRPTDWILFDVSSNNVNAQGAWCSSRADWYIQNYLQRAETESTVTSGGWEKFVRNYDSAPWRVPAQRALVNYYGKDCATPGRQSWCSEWYIGNGERERLAFIPDQERWSGFEIFSDFQGFADASLRIRVGADRESTCGF